MQHRFDARAFRDLLRWVVASTAIMATVCGPLAAPVQAAGERPVFQIPFQCAERWEATTRSGHRAVDWNQGTGSADLGLPVAASAAGTAVRKYHWAYGYYVDIDHGRGWVTRYAHLLESGRKQGTVAQGEVIGKLGSSGSSTSPHLHWEQRANDVPQSTLTADGSTIVADGRTYTSRNCLRRDPFLAGDVDGDGDDELVARFIKADGSSSVKIIAGGARRSLEQRPALSLEASVLPRTALLSLGDTNGDGRADLNAAFARDGGVQFVSFYGTGRGTFESRRKRYYAGGWSFARLRSVRSADVNGDGIEDLVAHFVGADSSVVRVVRGATGRVLTKQRSLTVPSSDLPRAAVLALGDTNADGRADLNAVVPAADGVRVISFFGTWGGTFTTRRSRYLGSGWRFANISSVRVGNIDAKSAEDVVIRFMAADGTSTIRVVRGRAGQTLRSVRTKTLSAAALPANAQVVVGDTTHDGRADLNAAYAGGGGTHFATFAGTSIASFESRTVRFEASGWDFHRLC